MEVEGGGIHSWNKLWARGAKLSMEKAGQGRIFENRLPSSSLYTLHTRPQNKHNDTTQEGVGKFLHKMLSLLPSRTPPERSIYCQSCGRVARGREERRRGKNEEEDEKDLIKSVLSSVRPGKFTHLERKGGNQTLRMGAISGLFSPPRRENPGGKRREPMLDGCGGHSRTCKFRCFVILDPFISSFP